MRVRSTAFGGFTDAYRQQWSRVCGGAVPSPSTISTIKVGFAGTKTITDIEIPNFRAFRRKCRGKLPINPVTISTIEEEVTPVYGEWTTKLNTCTASPWTTRVYGPYDDATTRTYLEPPPVLEEVVDYLCNAAVEKARSATIDVLTTLIELKDVRRTYEGCLRAIEHGFRNVKTASRKDVYLLAGHWLNLRYGILPSVYAMQDALLAYQGRRDTLVDGHTFQGQTLSLSETDSGGEAQSGRYASWVHTRLLTGTRKYRGMAYGCADLFALEGGFDPLQTAWELLPLSFVIDWFVQVGTWLAAVSPLTMTDVYASGVSIKTEYMCTNTVRLTQSGIPGYTVTCAAPQGLDRIKRVREYIRYSQSPTLPGWNPRLSTERYIDAAALAIAMRHRMLRMIPGL